MTLTSDRHRGRDHIPCFLLTVRLRPGCRTGEVHPPPVPRLRADGPALAVPAPI